MTAREPDDVIAELGVRLRAGMAQAEQQPWWRRALRRRPHRPVLLALVLCAFASTALATRDVLRAPSIPDLPPSLRAPGSLAPDRSTLPTYVADGARDGIPWRLSASACDYGGVQVIAAFLDVRGGGGGTRCDVAVTTSGATPQTLARRRIQTYYDPLTDRTWVFGVLPAAAATATVGHARAELVGLDERGAAGAGLPDGLKALVTTVPGAPDRLRVDVADAAGLTILSCTSGSCHTA